MPQDSSFRPGDTRSAQASHRVFHKAHQLEPQQGEVLAEADPRAWAGTLKFPESQLDPQAVQEHIQNCKDQGLLQDGKIPVRWDSGEVHWHQPVVLKAVPSPESPETPKVLIVDASGARQQFARYRAKGGRIAPLGGE